MSSTIGKPVSGLVAKSVRHISPFNTIEGRYRAGFEEALSVVKFTLKVSEAEEDSFVKEALERVSKLDLSNELSQAYYFGYVEGLQVGYEFVKERCSLCQK